MSEQAEAIRSEDVTEVAEHVTLGRERSRRGVKTPRRELEQQVLALVSERGEMSISDLHRALLKSTGVSYSMVPIIVGELMEKGYLGKVMSWPRRYYGLPSADAEAASQGNSPREIISATLGRGSLSGADQRRRGRDEDMGELETEVLSVANELGRFNLDALHNAMLTRHHVSYPDMLTAVRSLVRRRKMQRRREDNRYVYEVRSEDQY